MAGEGRLWTRRLRWRLRGAWQWPAFAALTVLDGVLLHELPPFVTGFALIPGLILASFANLFLIGAVAPWFARRMAVREAADAAAGLRPVARPFEVVLDRVATGLLVAGTLGLAVAGLASRPLIVSETEATELNAQTVRGWVLAHGTDEQRRNLDSANTIRVAEGYFRTCIATDDRRSVSCLFVDTNRRPPEVRRDASPTPNGEYLGQSDS